MDPVVSQWMEQRNLKLDSVEVFTYLSVLIALGRGGSVPEGLWALLVEHPRFWIRIPGVH
jgi:hypothetical protein